jgi:uncharacterized protein (TIGR02147 family)
MSIPDPFQYFDFRLWFREALADYSYSQVIEKLGLKSKGHITQILQGKKNVTPQLAEKIADFFLLAGRTRLFVLALIAFTQAKSHEDKKLCLDRMTYLQSDGGKTLLPSHYDLCKHWYYPVIRELIRIVPVVEEYDVIASMVSPPITERAAETAIRDLERMGLIIRNNQGRYIQTEAMITFGEEWKSVVVREFQRHAVELQKQAFDRYPAEEREISNATLCMSKECATLIKRKLQTFRKELISLVKEDSKKSEQVFQLNIGFFPLSMGKKI